MNNYHRSNLLIITLITATTLICHYLLDMKIGYGIIIPIIIAAYAIRLNLKALKNQKAAASPN